jgi:hypothetical protein
MDDTEFRRAVIRLCRKHPGFREKLAAEVRRPGSGPKTARREPGYMVWQSLRKMTDRVPELAAMVHDDADELEEWQQAKILLAAEYIDAVYDSLRYSMEDDKF